MTAIHRPGIGRRHLLAAALAGGAMAPTSVFAAQAATPAARAGASALPANAARTIRRVTATALSVPVSFPYANPPISSREHCCYVEIETSDGLIGHGISGIADARSIADIVTNAIAPAITGDDAMRSEAIWNKLYWLLTPRGQSGLAVHAISAVDIALWDIRGKALGVPIATLLGGARQTVAAYCTFGPDFFTRDQLVAAARDVVGQGFHHIKMVVASGVLRRRDSRPIRAHLEEDVARVAAVRAAVGDSIELSIDGNCNMDYPNAKWLIDALKPYKLSFVEEPLTQNDAHLLATLREATGATITAGQNEGRSSRFRDLMIEGAVDYIQPNVMIGGGFTQCLKIAGMADAFNVPIANGGAAGLHNMHLHAGLSNGGPVEWHIPFMEMCRQIFVDIPRPSGGKLTIPDRPGLGFEPNRDAIREIAARPWVDRDRR